MKKFGILFSLVFILSSASAFALTNRHAEAFEVFGISLEQVESLKIDPRLDLSIDAEAKLFSRLLTAIQISQLPKLDIGMNDETHMPSYLVTGKTMAQTGEVSAAVRLVEALGLESICHVDLVAVASRSIVDNFGLERSSGYGFVDFFQANQDLYNIKDLAASQQGFALEQRLTEIINRAADQYASSGVASFSTCGNSSIGLTENKCCAGSDDGVAQQCNDKDDSKCGIFRRNGTIVCRVGSESC